MVCSCPGTFLTGTFSDLGESRFELHSLVCNYNGSNTKLRNPLSAEHLSTWLCYNVLRMYCLRPLRSSINNREAILEAVWVSRKSYSFEMCDVEVLSCHVFWTAWLCWHLCSRVISWTNWLRIVWTRRMLGIHIFKNSRWSIWLKVFCLEKSGEYTSVFLLGLKSKIAIVVFGFIKDLLLDFYSMHVPIFILVVKTQKWHLTVVFS